jgi:NifB/MoaA-like Fe-S oxidoreductase
VVAQVTTYQRALRKQFGKTLVYLADEFYLLAGIQPPSGRYYDGYPQYENGIGMLRSLKDDWARLRRRLEKSEKLPARRLTVASGLLVATALQETLAELRSVSGWQVELVAVENRLFGKNINVAGLLAGKDVIEDLRGKELGDCVILPRAMLDSEGARTLDDLTPREIEDTLGVPVRFANNITEMVKFCASSFN